MRKVSVTLFALALLLAFQVGSAFADTKLDKTTLEKTIAPLIGAKYKYGGTTPSGFDCSGFTGYVFNELGLDLPRSSRDLFSWEKSKKIADEDLRAGDLVFFNTSGSGVSHVGIYIGDNKFAHAASKGVTITSLDESYYEKRYLGARRILGDEYYKKIATVPEAEEEAKQ